MKIVFQSEKFVVVRKDWGEHVHQPENHDYWVDPEIVLVTQLKMMFNQERVYPVHRLDAPTRGLIVFGLTKDAASELNQTSIEKKYFALVRGWTELQGRIEIELESDSTNEMVSACTDYISRRQFELPFAVGKKYQTSRYSLVEVELQTGRYHQIRRHFNRISHPIIGDREHGDSLHNRFFREQMKISGLCLWAYSLNFQFQNTLYSFQDERDEVWKKIFAFS